MSLSFHHHAILVSDLETAETFYGGVLGLAVKKRWLDKKGRPRSIWYELGGETFLAIELHGGSRERPERGSSRKLGHHCFALAIRADERDAWLSRLAAANVEIEKASEFSLYFRDPEGNQIALSHWPQKQILATAPKPL